MKFSYCQLTALIYAVLALTPCACKKTQCGSDGVCNEDATDEVAALQVHVDLATMPTTNQSGSYGKFTDESNILRNKVDDANILTKTTNAVKGTITATSQAPVKRKPSNLTDVLVNTASGRVLGHFLKEDDLTRLSIPQKDSSSFSGFLFSVASGATLKIFLGMDDLIWLGPIMSRTTSRIMKLKVLMVYGLATPLVVALAVYLGSFIDGIGDSFESLNFWVSIVAGVLLMTYSTYMAYSEGWFARCGLRGDDDDDEDDEKKGECDTAKPMAFSQVATITVLGSVDDFATLFLLATSGLFTWWSMCIGTCLGSVCLGGIVMLSTASQTVTSFLQSLPMPFVLFAVGVWITTAAFQPPESLEVIP